MLACPEGSAPLAGIGWGNMPLGMIEDDLARGRMVELPMEK